MNIASSSRSSGSSFRQAEPSLTPCPIFGDHISRITGVEKPSLLIASHIKPWRACGTAAERLDGFNGLMLAPHADFLFDHGLIGFEEDGRSLFSSQLQDADAVKLGLHMIQCPPPRPMRAESHDYIRHHRSTVFIP
ncbi:HNH endonuclease [Xanthobacter sp. V4C-4]|uniref:HNH endonuclease n=1 Tax=Xanthobacter cornucopiae TaxID=3119924 RepID=UPI00372C09D6